ncbi:DUF6273 domain-containing protein [Megasphaera sp.]|uniref:DUF6273 domain-containing protein n=1 Tax=Megasphaera sp. TaxID=2023260 RepID=UPI003F7D9598
MATKLGAMAVGSTVKIKVNGASKDFIVVQQGNPNTSTYDSSCNGTWLLMKDIYTTSTFGNNNSYKDSSIHTYLNGTFYNLIDSNIRAAIKQVKIPYQNGTGFDGSLATGSNGLSTKVFLLSGYEVGWTTSDNTSFPQDGAKLDYFGSGDDGNSKRVAYNGSSAAVWWLRSPNTNYSNSVWTVKSDGSYDVFGYSNTCGVRPAFVLPSALLVSDDGTVIGNCPPEVTSDAGATGAELGEKNAPFTVGYTVTDKDGTLMTVTEKLDGEVKAVKTDVGGTVVKVQTVLNDDGAVPAWDTYPAKSEFFMPLTAKKAGLLLRSLEFRVKGYVPGTMRAVLRKYGSTTALADKFIDIVRGYNDVVLDMGSIALEKGVEYQLYFAASNNFYPPSVTPGWVVENDYVDIATGSAYYGGDTTLIFSGTMGIVETHTVAGTDGATTDTLTVDWLNEKEGYTQVLNGAHTLTLTVSDGIASVDWTATFTKNVTSTVLSLAQPLTADDTITVAALTLEGSFPTDMSLTVEMTNNALDETPMWENCTDIQRGESRAFVHHSFTNKTAAKGAAFNYKVTIARGASGVGGSVTMIGGVIG